MNEKRYYVYIITNKHNTTLYTGVTNDLPRRINEHRRGTKASFSHRYNLYKLIFLEAHPDITSAINREKQIKAGPRIRKVELINSINPEWDDPFENWDSV